MNCLYILEIDPLSGTSIENIVSHSVGCLFILFMVSFAVQKVLHFLRSHLLFFVCFHYSTRQIQKKKMLLLFMPKSVLPVFCLSFVLSGLIFRSLIHFEVLCAVLENVLISFFYM